MKKQTEWRGRQLRETRENEKIEEAKPFRTTTIVCAAVQNGLAFKVSEVHAVNPAVFRLSEDKTKNAAVNPHPLKYAVKITLIL
jgi:hypothetical protein